MPPFLLRGTNLDDCAMIVNDFVSLHALPLENSETGFVVITRRKNYFQSFNFGKREKHVLYTYSTINLVASLSWLSFVHSNV